MSGRKSLKSHNSVTRTVSFGGGGTSLSEQYNVIKKDILKLRKDLSKGYDITKGLVEKKSLIDELFKIK